LNIKNLYIFYGSGIIFAVRRRVKLILTLFLVGAVFTMGVLLYVNFHTSKELSGTFVRPFKADIRIEKARYVETRDGRTEWELEADSAQYFKDDNLTVFENVRVVFYSQNGINYILEGKKGRLRNDTKDMDVFGDVVVTSGDGYKLKTDSLRYSAAVKQITSNDRVVFTGPNIKIEGIGLLADMITDRVSVLANVRTVLKDAAI